MGRCIVGLEGLRLSTEESTYLLNPLVAGVILFSRNYDSPVQLQTLTTAIHALRPSDPLEIYIDQEGGRVQRCQTGFTRLPPAAELGSQAAYYGQIMAQELKAQGVDFSFAPVVDLNAGSAVIGNRAFGDTPEQVIRQASAYMAGMRQVGMPAIIKHFPGHGTALADTHHAIAIDARPFELIAQTDLRPFHHFIQQGVWGIMAAHVIYPAVDSLPVSFSKRWLTDILRGQLGYQGRIFTDDLGMKAAQVLGSPAELVQMAFDAGADYALLCNDFDAIRGLILDAATN